MRARWLAVLVVGLSACSLPPGVEDVECPGPWQVQSVDVDGWVAQVWTRDTCGFPDMSMDYEVWERTDGTRQHVLAGGSLETKHWTAPVVVDRKLYFGIQGASVSGERVNDQVVCRAMTP